MSYFLFFLSEISVVNGILYFDSKKNKSFELIENVLPLPDTYLETGARCSKHRRETRVEGKEEHLVNKSRAFCLFCKVKTETCSVSYPYTASAVFASL